MKPLLIILPYVPYPLRRGTFQRVFHLTRELGRAFPTDLFCLSQEPDDEAQRPVFAPFCRRMHWQPFQHPPWPRLFPHRLFDPLPTTVGHWRSAEALEALRDFTRGVDYGAISFCDLVLWPYAEAVFPRHNGLFMDRGRVDWLFQTEELRTLDLSWKERLLRRECLWKVARLERRAAARLAGMVVCGPEDRAFLEARLGDASRIHVLANGYNPEHFDPRTHPPQPAPRPTAIFCGALDYSPNVDGLEWYFREIHPAVMKSCPSFKLEVVGKSPGVAADRWRVLPGVEVVGEVPDVRPHYQRAWFQIVPLRIGGGTRLKIVESLGLGIPVISTVIGAQGLALRDGHELLLADDPDVFAKAIGRLIEDAALRSALARQGCLAVQTNYAWEGLAKPLLDLLRPHLEYPPTP